MRDLFTAPFVQPVSGLLGRYLERLQSAETVQLSAPATLEGVLAMGQLEAAFLDCDVKYSRRFTAPRQHVPRDETTVPEPPAQGLGVFLNVEEETWSSDDLAEEALLNLVPIQTSVVIGSKHKPHVGALDPVLQAAALGAALAPNGRRVRAFRPFLSLGLWLRGALDTSYDPIHSSTVSHLQNEGSLRTVPLPEVEDPVVEMMPGMAPRQLKRLRRAWPNMDVDQRTQALSELVLPCLPHPGLSTPRLEELVWHRMVLREHPQDVVSQAHRVQTSWPKDLDEARLFASRLLDRWLRTGMLSPIEEATD